MDFINDLLDFQINCLGYQFQNVNLLIEALTQHCETIYCNRDFPEKNQNYDKLGFVGEAVLKLVVSQYCIMATKIGTDQGNTWLKSRLLEVPKQNEIGEKLVSSSSDQDGHTITINNVEVRGIVRVADSNLINPAFKMGYHKILKALFGAVFIDAGGSKGIGLEKCLKLFLKLWKPFLKPKDSLKKLSICFPSPKREIHQFWLKNGINLKFIKRMEQTLGVEFKKGDILCEAVIQKSFYDPIRNDAAVQNMAQPDYERLEFLGDGVLGLIVTEHIWNNYNKEKNVAEMVDMVNSFIIDDHQVKIFYRLGIGEFVKMKRGRIREWKKQGDMVESVVGAVFVDGGIFKAGNFIKKAFHLQTGPSLRNLDLRSLEYKLNYSFKNKQLLVDALTFPTTELLTKKSNMEKVGCAIVSLFLVDYKTRTCDTKEDEIFLQKNFKPDIVQLSKPILEGIASYLNIRHYAETINDDDDLVDTHWDNFVVLIFGAIWMDLEKEDLYPWATLENVFYNVFNPYLLKSPKKLLLDTNINDYGSVNVKKIVEILAKLPYKFKDPMSLHHVFNEKRGLLQIKTELIGLHIIHLSSLLQMRGYKPKRIIKKFDIEKEIITKVKDKLHVKLFMEKWTETNEDKLTRILVGLIYVDVKSKDGRFITRRSQDGQDISWLFNLLL